MTKRAAIITWSSIGAAVIVVAVIAMVWSARPVRTIEGYPLDAVGTSDHVEGASNPSVILVEYSDFECPYCAVYYEIVKQLLALYADQLAVVFRNYPLPGHANALPAAKAAEAAGRQGKFFEMHNLLFDNQDAWSNLSDPTTVFEGYAQEIGLDMNQYRVDVASQDVADSIDRQIESGDAAKVNGTPTFFLNGSTIEPSPTLDSFRTLIDQALKTVAEGVHIHANLRVVVDGTPVDFSQDQYQSTDSHVLSEDVHFHGGNGDVVHVHAVGATINDLLSSLGMNLGRDCLKLDSSTTKCATGSNKLRMYVDGVQNSEYGDYVFSDLDRILITYGSDAETVIQTQINAVPDDACIYSGSCPERGTPAADECTGSETSDCS